MNIRDASLKYKALVSQLLKVKTPASSSFLSALRATEGY